jgi:DNA repair exonuclease SbcCD ATPase subunit
MRVITLTAENVKRLKAVEITPDGNVVVIAGRNAQGKSSVLDALWMTLAGAGGSKDTSKPIREGQEKAVATVDLGDIKVTRRWSASGTTLEVASKDGAKYPSPQTMLDSLIGRLSFDPLEFAQQDSRAQLATLLSVVELPFVPAELDERRRAAFDRRTEVNRTAKQLAAQITGLGQVPDETPEEEISAGALLEELEAARDSNETRRQAQEDVTDRKSQVELAEAELHRAQRSLAEAKTRFESAQERLEKAPAFIDTAPIVQRMEQRDEVNRNVRILTTRRELETTHKAAEQTAAKLTGELEKIDREKADGLAAANMPLEGLSFDETGVLYHGVPFSQASAAERLRVGIAIAMAVNPKIRVIRITDGSLLDSENLRLIEEMCDEHDFQCWLEKVDETGTVGVVIEDGQVVQTESEAA